MLWQGDWLLFFNNFKTPFTCQIFFPLLKCPILKSLSCYKEELHYFISIFFPNSAGQTYSLCSFICFYQPKLYKGWGLGFSQTTTEILISEKAGWWGGRGKQSEAAVLGRAVFSILLWLPSPECWNISGIFSNRITVTISSSSVHWGNSWVSFYVLLKERWP